MQTPTPSTHLRLVHRAVTLSVVTLVVFIAGEAAGPGWYDEFQQWRQPTPHRAPPMHRIDEPPLGAPAALAPVRPAGNNSSVSAVPLALKLIRTQRGRNSRDGLAQIGVRADSPQTYTAGALLANGARLTEIYEDSVVIERHGRSVRLFREGLPQSASASTQDLLTVGGTRASNDAPKGSSAVALTDFLRPSPVYSGSQLHGLALYPGRELASFAELGLQPGDVVTQLNGARVTDATASIATLEALLDGEAVTVAIEREGVTQTLSLDGRILARAAAERPARLIPAVTASGTTT